jgi:lipopolysaccharide export system permease protein
MENMFREFLELLHRANWGQILTYYALLLPGFLPTVIPVSTFIAVLLGLGKLNRNQEIIAMRCAGMGVGSITWTLWMGTFFLSLFLLGMTASVVPITDGLAEKFLADIRGGTGEMSRHFSPVTYDNRIAHRLWILGGLDLSHSRAHRVVCHMADGNGLPLSSISADSARYDNGHWILFHGKERREDLREGESCWEEKAFEDWTESPKLIALAQRGVRDLSLPQLHRILESIPRRDPLRAVYETRWNFLWASCWTPLLTLFCAIPFSIRGGRRNPAIGASQASGLLFAFYVVANVAQVLGSNGHLPPFLAAWLPNLSILVVGLWLLRKVGH